MTTKYTTWTFKIPNVIIIYPMDIKYNNSKALQNIPKFGFWFANTPSGNPADELGHKFKCALSRKGS
jgi:hypothetical protein